MKQKNTIVLLSAIIALIFGFDAYQVGAVTPSPVGFGGTGSSTLTGILIGNGINPINTLTIGSNLTLTGTTLSATGGGGTGVGTVSTSSVEANSYVPYFTTDAGYPAQLGSSPLFAWAAGTLFMNSTDGNENWILGRYNGQTRGYFGYDVNKNGQLVLVDSSDIEKVLISSATASLFGTGLLSTGSTTINGNATTTGVHYMGTASSTDTFGSGLRPCQAGNFLTWNAGGFGCAADQTSSGANPFAWAENFAVINAATSSVIWAQSGINASSTSRFVNASTSMLSILGTPIGTTTEVCKQSGACQFNTIQGALTAGWRPIAVNQGTFAEQLTISNSKTRIQGDSLLSTLQVNGATQSPGITVSADEFILENLTMNEANAASVGRAIDMSNVSLGRLLFNRINNFATSTTFNDTSSLTFYNLMMGNAFLNFGDAGYDFSAGTQANAINSAFNRLRPMQTGNGGWGIYLGDTRGFNSFGDDIEGTTTSSGVTGVFASSTSRDNNFYGPWIEAHTIGLDCATGFNRTGFFGGTITSNGTDISTNCYGTLTALNVNVTGKTLNTIGTRLGVATTTSYNATNPLHVFGVTGSSLFNGNLVIDAGNLDVNGGTSHFLGVSGSNYFSVDSSGPYIEGADVNVIAAGQLYLGGQVLLDGPATTSGSHYVTGRLTAPTASTTDFSARTLAVGGAATTTISTDGNLTVGGLLRQASNLDIYPQNQLVRGLRISDDGTNVELSGLGVTNIDINDGLTVVGAATTTSLNTGSLIANASSTIGAGTRIGGLTISGGATTTGIAYFASSVGVGTTSPGKALTVVAGNVDGIKIETTSQAPVFDLYSQGGGSTRNYRLATNFNIAGTFEILGSSATGGVPSLSRLVISSAGLVGIGQTAPGSLLSVNGAGSFGAAWSTLAAPTNGLMVQGNVGIGSTTPFAKLGINALSTDTNTILFAIASSTASATTTHFIVTNTGNTGVGTTSPWRTLSVTGTVALSGLTALGSSGNSLCIVSTSKEVEENAATTCLVSSIKTKHDISTLNASIEQVMQLNPTSFTYNDTGKKDVGFIADEVAAIDPRLVDFATKDVPLADGQIIKEGEPLTIRVHAILSLVTKAVQEQQAQIDALKGGVVAVKRSVEENWQWAALALLALGLLYQQRQIRQLKKHL